MQHRCARLAGIAVCAAALAAGPASAETQTFTTPGTTPVTLPTGVTRVHVVAVGGRGGGASGGFGAVVTGDVGVLLPGIPETSPRLLIRVGGNGGIGVAGVNSGGEAGAPGFPTFAGGGGGASTLAPCMQLAPTGDCAVYLNQLLAGGGGGAGAPTVFEAGGAGGSAGAPGSAGTSTAALTAASGGGAGAAAGGASGVGSLSSDPQCEDGSDGDSGGIPTSRNGGAGGLSADLSGHGDGGGGGGGVHGGGGGGGGAFCSDNSGTSGAGGGGGSSNVPPGGTLATDTTGQPSVTITYELEHPTVVLTIPTDGAVYGQGRKVTASYACAAPAALPQDHIASCTGTSASGAPLDTRTLGLHEFTVTATDVYGLTAEQTVHYDVVDQTAPRIARLRIAPRSIDASEPGDYATVSFRLKERARVRVSVQPVRGGSGHATRARARVLVGHAGRNSFRLRARSGSRALAPGTYRLKLVATDRAGNRSRAVARFVVTD